MRYRLFAVKLNVNRRLDIAEKRILIYKISELFD